MVLTNTLGACKAREIWVRIHRQLNLLERGIHTDRVGDAFLEVRDREIRVERHVEEEEKRLVRRFHSTVLSGKLQKEVCQATKR